MNLIACITLNHCIGKEGKLAVRIPEDLKRFKKLTTGNIVVMGANTFFGDLEGKPLPNRINAVLSRKLKDILDDDFEKESNLYFIESTEMLNKALPIINKNNREVFCIGGAATYKALLPQVDTMYVTHTNSIVKDGDSFLNVDWSKWNVEEVGFAEECNCTFAKYVRKS